MRKGKDEGVEKIVSSICKVSISTRASSRLHKLSPTIEKSKKLIKKAVAKSKQIKTKITPRVLRRLHPRKEADMEIEAQKDETNAEKESEQRSNLDKMETNEVNVDAVEAYMKSIPPAVRNPEPEAGVESNPSTKTMDDDPEDLQ